MNVRTIALVILAATGAGLAGAAYALRTDAAGVAAAEARSERGAAPAAADELAALRAEIAELRSVASGVPLGALANLRVPQELQLCGRALPLGRPALREALAYELVLTIGKPTMPLLWMRRAPVILPQIEAKLKARGLPDDLKYLAMIESDLRWTAESPAGALGLWQFMKATGQRHGLRVDATSDERMDPEASTDAALRYLAALHKQFGDWYLALAAYNAGENLVQRMITEQGKRDYFNLYLPSETRRYIFRLAAAKLVYERPEDYGLFRMNPLDTPIYREVEVRVPAPGGDLVAIARARNLDYADLRIHNPQLRGPKLSPGTYRLRVPTH